MKRTHLIAVFVGLVAIAVLSSTAHARYYQTGMNVYPTVATPMPSAPNLPMASAPMPSTMAMPGRMPAPVTANFNRPHVGVNIYPSVSTPLPSNPMAQYADGMNLYQFVRSNPVNLMDPTGMKACCGPDVTDSLRNLMAQVKNDWNKWDWWEKNRRCNGMVDGAGWDVSQLQNKSVREKGCGTGNCKGTVRAYDGCHDSAQVNYILWGKMNKLCGNSLVGTLAWVAAWKQYEYGHQDAEALQWTAIGYGGIGKYTIGLAGSIINDRKACADCGKKSNVKFTYYWSREGNAWVRINY